jgi:CBS domain-containing protein/mannitol/fructose-specific phosphotransferase system IIA component (Ntr-type)
LAEATETRPALTAAQVAPSLATDSYAEVLDELATFAVRQAGVVDRDRLLREISSLGAEDTVALGGGAFLAHLRTDAVEGVITVLGRTERPLRVPTETGEETRGRLFVLVAASPDAPAAYLETIATLAALLRREGVIEAILAAATPQEIAELEAVRTAPRVQKLSVVDVMDPAPNRIYPDMSLREAAGILMRGRHSGLPVVNRNDEIVGMISEKDLIRSFLPGYLRVFSDDEASPREDAREGAIRDVMSKAVLCLPIEASISEAASIIVNKNVDPLPVTREGKWVGLISRRSLIRKLLQF